VEECTRIDFGLDVMRRGAHHSPAPRVGTPHKKRKGVIAHPPRRTTAAGYFFLVAFFLGAAFLVAFLVAICVIPPLKTTGKEMGG
jgi:hypothetical protein